MYLVITSQTPPPQKIKSRVIKNPPLFQEALPPPPPHKYTNLHTSHLALGIPTPIPAPPQAKPKPREEKQRDPSTRNRSLSQKDHLLIPASPPWPLSPAKHAVDPPPIPRPLILRTQNRPNPGLSHKRITHTATPFPKSHRWELFTSPPFPWTVKEKMEVKGGGGGGFGGELKRS